MKMCICKTIRACPKRGPVLATIFSTTTPKGRIRRWATKHLTRCTMQNEHRVARARAHGGSPVLSSAFGCKAIFSSEQRVTVLCKQTTCQEMNDCDRLPNQQPVHLRKKERRNCEANNFYLKSCPADWVHLSTSKITVIQAFRREFTNCVEVFTSLFNE